MRSGLLLFAVAVAGGSGCTLARNAVHNLTNETVAHWDEKKLSRQLRAEADAAWRAYCAQAGGPLSEDFAAGFRDGYADYLESGGNGSPPAVPPLRYRRTAYLNPDGHARIRDYFAGFKTGTDCAAASGHRQYLTVPVLLSGDPPAAPLPGVQLPAAGPPVRAGERLPTPRAMDAGTGLPIPDRPVVQPLPKSEPPPQSRREEPAAGQPPVVPASAEVPAARPGSPLTLPPTPPPDVPTVRRSIDR